MLPGLSDNTRRILLLNAVLAIVVGLVLGGGGLTLLVTRDAYGQAIPFHVPGDMRGWRMAHLEGLLNGLLAIGLVVAMQGRALSARAERAFSVALLTSTWGNTVVSLLAPVMGVRAIAFNGQVANDALAGAFGIALIGTIVAFVLVIRALIQRTAS